MKSEPGNLRSLLPVLALMVSTALLTAWFMVMRDRQRLALQQPTDPPLARRNVIADAATASEAVRSPDDDLEWSRDEIRSLKAHVGNRTILALLDLLRERDGAPVNYYELMERTGRTMPQVRADLASFSRAVKRIEGREKWPIHTMPATDGVSRIAYATPQKYLDWWFEE